MCDAAHRIGSRGMCQRIAFVFAYTSWYSVIPSMHWGKLRMRLSTQRPRTLSGGRENSTPFLLSRPVVLDNQWSRKLDGDKILSIPRIFSVCGVRRQANQWSRSGRVGMAEYTPSRKLPSVHLHWYVLIEEAENAWRGSVHPASELLSSMQRFRINRSVAIENI